MVPLDFQYYFADIILSWIQPGFRNSLCEFLKELNSSKRPIEEQIKILADEAALKYGHTADPYKFSSLKDIIISKEKNMRQWTYQVCTTFGWFQNPYPMNPIRSSMINNTYWKKYCKEVFDKDLFPDVERTNHEMGHLIIAKEVSNVIFSQGSEDGWQWTGITENMYNNKKIDVKIIRCDKCSHCIDIKPAVDSDPENLKNARKEEIEMIKKWLS